MSFDLTPSEETRQIEEAAGAMLAAHYDPARDPGGEDMGPLAEFGAFAFGLEDGFGLSDEAALHVLFGRHLLSPRAVAGAIAARIDPALADGARVVCAGIMAGDGAILLDAQGADLALIRVGARLALYDLAGTAPEPAPAMGGTGTHHRRARSAFGEGRAAGPEAYHLWQLLLGAQLLGCAEGARDLAVDYAKTREQFGRPIGGFQAIKHHAADMAVACEKASALLDMAALTVRGDPDQGVFMLSALARLAPQIALDVARAGIQIHGGMGFSEECLAHRYLKSAHSLGALMGADDILSCKAPMAPYRPA